MCAGQMTNLGNIWQTSPFGQGPAMPTAPAAVALPTPTQDSKAPDVSALYAANLSKFGANNNTNLTGGTATTGNTSGNLLG